MDETKLAQPSSKLRLYIRSKGGKCRTFQTKDEEEWYEYIHLLQPLCTAKPSEKPNKTTSASEWSQHLLQLITQT